MTTVFYAAFERDGLTPILFPRGYTPAVIAYALDDRRTKWGKNPNCRRMLVEDTDTGQVIGYSEWFVHSEKKQDPKRDEKTPALPQQPTSSPPPDCNLEKLAEVMECHTSQRQKIVGGKPYLCKYERPRSLLDVCNRQRLYPLFLGLLADGDF